MVTQDKKCPNCGQYKLSDKYHAPLGGGGMTNTRRCSNCGYEE